MASSYLDPQAPALQRGDVDDVGDSRYQRLSQNVPNRFVVDLQSDLNSLGFNVGVADGAFGRQTRAGLKAFQEDAGLPSTGIVDDATRAKLSNRLGPDSRSDRSVPQRPAQLPSQYRMIEPVVPHYSQGDPRWGDRILGKHSTIQRKGCAITCVAMILSFFKRPATPAELDAFLDQEGGYSRDSIIWRVAARYRAPNARDHLAYGRDDKQPVEVIHKRLSQGLPSLVRVDYGVDGDLVYNHFVVAVGSDDQGRIIMNDPASRYGDGFALPSQNIIETTDRKGGYRVVQADWYDLA